MLQPLENPRPTRAKPQPPRARASRLPNTNPLTDPQKRDLQHRCHHRYVVEGSSYSAIARELGIDRDVVSAYVRVEAERRAAERQVSLDAEVDRSIAIYTDAGRRALFRMDQPGARGDELRWVIYARERIDRLLGLEAAVKIRDERPPAEPLVGISHEGLSAVLQLAIQLKAGPA